VSDEKIPKHPDPVAPVFFVSHATAHDQADGPKEPNSVFLEFATDLNEDLNHGMARRAGANPGFIDRGLRGGQDWEQEILTAIGTCQVLVALISEPFSQSPWCGMEWHAFTRRRTWRRSDGSLVEHSRCVLPVLWNVSSEDSAPQIVLRHQRFKPRPTRQSPLDQLYRSEGGIYGMYRVEYDAYRATVWRIAQEIQQLVSQFWVEPLIPPDSASLINVFAEEDS
jgi:hypothetical protein